MQVKQLFLQNGLTKSKKYNIQELLEKNIYKSFQKHCHFS